jgi:hypothetical protein
MNCKAKGNRNERKARAILVRMGYELVVKSGGSLGVFDLIGLGPDLDNALLIQVRSNRKLGKSEMDILRAFQVPKFCKKELWVFKDYQRNPEILEL